MTYTFLFGLCCLGNCRVAVQFERFITVQCAGMRIQQSATYSMHHLAPLPYCIWPHYPVLCITVAWMFDSCARAVDVRAKLRALALPGAGYSVQLIQNSRRRFHPW